MRRNGPSEQCDVGGVRSDLGICWTQTEINRAITDSNSLLQGFLNVPLRRVLNLSYNSATRRSKDLLLRYSFIDICVTFRLTGSSCTAQHSKSLRQERKTPTKQDPCTVKDTGNGYRNDSSLVRTFPNFIVC